MQQLDPHPAYAPPQAPPVYRQNVFVPPDAVAGPLLGPGLRVAKLVLGILQMVAATTGLVLLVIGAVVGLDDGGQTYLVIGGSLFALWNLLIIAYAVVTLVWAYKLWSWIPPEHRYTELWKKYISPLQATLFMLIPFFGLFWIVVLNLGIADILDRMRVAYPTKKQSAKTIALINTIVGFVFFPAAPFTDWLFDKHVEELAAEMHVQMTAPTDRAASR